MGQYHIPVNLDKREFINPHGFGDGLKLMEQALSGEGGTATALVLLLAASNGEGGRGGGDFRADDTDGVIGRWAGDRIAFIGDYAEPGDLPNEHDHPDLIYTLCGATKAELPEIAQDYRERADEFDRIAARCLWDGPENSERAKGWRDKAKRYRDLADIIPKLKPYKDITAKVRRAQAAEGYITYTKSPYGTYDRTTAF